MSFDFLPFATRKQRDTWVLRMLEGGLEKGESGASILRTFRSAGGKIANNTFSSLLKEARSTVEKRDYFRSLDTRFIVPASDFTQFSTDRVNSRFLLQFDTAWRVKGTDEIEYGFYSIGSNDWISPDSALAELADRFGSSDYELVAAELIGAKAQENAFRNP